MATLTAPGQGLRNTIPGAGFTFGVDGGAVTGVSEIIPNSITSASLQTSLAQTAIVTPTVAQVQGMNATPIILVPAPGTGLSIAVDYIVFKYVYAATVYASGGTITMGYTGGAAAVNTLAASILTTAASSTTVCVTGSSNVTASINTALQITNATGAFTGGTGSTLTILVSYTVI
jgi:hypothetical protein